MGLMGFATLNPPYGMLLVAHDATALSIGPACASLVGAPLTHNFCSISLSDLLTPWAVIEKRLEAAAMADFVVALYNPKSGRRTQQIVGWVEQSETHHSPNFPFNAIPPAQSGGYCPCSTKRWNVENGQSITCST